MLKDEKRKMIYDSKLKKVDPYKKLSNYIVNIDDSIYYAYWKLCRNRHILCVLDDENNFEGIITKSDVEKTFYNTKLLLKDICNKNPHIIIASENPEDNYRKAKYLFSEYTHMTHIPVIDENRKLIDIFSRQRIYWKNYFDMGNLPRMEYATAIYYAALEAKKLGYKEISIIEFGVASGNGLLTCEFHAAEISKLLNIKISIYGFDSGEGLLNENLGYKDMVHIWPNGSYKMDMTELKNRITESCLVIGDIEDTVDEFLESKPAPIGGVLIDVDRYSATLPILKMFEQDDSFFLPRVYMYFDDITNQYEFSGENLAIKEFNLQHDIMKISPESLSNDDEHYLRKLKILHRFQHQSYNMLQSEYDWKELSEKDYEISLFDII